MLHPFLGWYGWLLRWHRSGGDGLNELLDHLLVHLLVLFVGALGNKPVLEGDSEGAATTGAYDVDLKACGW